MILVKPQKQHSNEGGGWLETWHGSEWRWCDDLEGSTFPLLLHRSAVERAALIFRRRGKRVWADQRVSARQAKKGWVNRIIKAICCWAPRAQAHYTGSWLRSSPGRHAKLGSRCDRQCSLAINQQAEKLKGQRVTNGTICLTVRDWLQDAPFQILLSLQRTY